MRRLFVSFGVRTRELTPHTAFRAFFPKRRAGVSFRPLPPSKTQKRVTRPQPFNSKFDFDAHLTAGASDDLHRGFFVTGVEVRHLGLGNFEKLLFGELADFRLVGLFAAAGDFERLFDHRGRWRLLRDEGEALVFIDGDDDREDVTRLLRRASVELFAERHDVDALLSECRTDGRCGVCLSSGDLEFDGSYDFFCHDLDWFFVGRGRLRARFCC